MSITIVPGAFRSDARSLRPGDDLKPVLQELVTRANLNHTATARLLGVSRQCVEQQLSGHRVPSLLSFLHTVEACNGRVVIEMPAKELP